MYLKSKVVLGQFKKKEKIKVMDSGPTLAIYFFFFLIFILKKYEILLYLC